MGGFAELLRLAGRLLEHARDPNFFSVVSWFLALVFIASSLPKLRHPGRTATAIYDFGVGPHPIPTLGFLLGLGELGLAALLAASLWFGTLLAALLLWIFALAIARSLRAGRHFACFCFGSSDDAMSWATLARTVVLAVLTSFLFALDVSARPAEGLAGRDHLIAVIVASSLFAIVALILQGGALLQSSRATLRALENLPS